jgi:hypothetical protein
MDDVKDVTIAAGAWAELPTERLEAEVTTLAAHLAAATGRWLMMIGELDRREAWLAWECRSMAHWLAWHCGMSLPAAHEHVRVARALEHLPAIAERLCSGRLSYSKVRAISRIATVETEQDLIRLATDATASQLERIVAGLRYATQAADRDRAATNTARRGLQYTTDADGNVLVMVRLRSDAAATLLAALDAATERELPAEPDDTVAQRRADALEAIARRYVQPDPDRPPPVALDVRVEPGQTASIAGLPLDDTQLARLACDATLRIHGLGDGPVTTTSIPRAVRHAIRFRDHGTCRWHGCSNTRHLHIHHIRWRSRHGTHARTNLVLLCPAHHRAVHDLGWTIHGDPDRHLTFNAPDGRTLTKPPATSGDADELTHQHHTAGIPIHPDTLRTASGERADIHWTVDTIAAQWEIRARRAATPT